MLNRFNTSFPFPFQRGEQERSVPDERWTLVEPRFESARIVFPWHFQVSSSPRLESGPRAGSWTWTGDRGGEAAIKLAEFHVDRDKGSRRLCRSRLKKKKRKKNARRHETTIYHLRFKADTKNCGNLNGNRGFRLFTRNPATYSPRIFILCPTNDRNDPGINGEYLEMVRVKRVSFW